MMSDGVANHTQEPGYCCSNRTGRLYLLALEEVVGKNAVNAILNQAGLRKRINNYPPENLDLGWGFAEMSASSRALVQVYGPEEGADLAAHVGQAWFHRLLPDFAAVLGIAELAYRLLPFGMRVKLGLQAIADTFRNTGAQLVQVLEDADTFQYRIERCPECWDRSAEVPVCHTYRGLLQEGSYWMVGRREVQVQESTCIARDDPACTFVVAKQQLE